MKLKLKLLMFSKSMMFVGLLGINLTNATEVTEQKTIQVNHGRLSDYFYDRLCTWHNKRVDIVEKEYNDFLQRKFSMGINQAKSSEYDPICKIRWTRPNGDFLSHGTGVLIDHPDNPMIKGILTAAHVVKKENATCTITFAKDETPRKLKETIFLDKKEGGYGVDLAVLKLETDPDIRPAKRSREHLRFGEDIFAHTAGYGQFYTHFDGESSEGLVLDNWRFIHAASGIYQMGDKTVGEHKILFNSLEKNKNFDQFRHLGNEFLLSKHSEILTLNHPITNSPFPCAPLKPGFSGSPILNTNNEIMAIFSELTYRSWGIYRPFYIYYPRLSRLHSWYNSISEWTKGYLLGENSRNTSNIVGGVMVSTFVYKLWNHPLSEFSPKSVIGSFALLSLWKLTNTLGVGLDRFSNGFDSFKVLKAGHNCTLAIPIEPWNKRIDEALVQSRD